MLPTREDAERLSEAFRGRDLLAMLEALQGFELKNEDMPLLDTDAVMVVATATMYVTSNVAQKLKAMSNDEANKFALPMNNLYQLLVDLINELQQRTVVQRMNMMRRDEIVNVHKSVWHGAWTAKNKPSGSMVKCMEKLKSAYYINAETTDEWFTNVDDAITDFISCFNPACDVPSI